MNRVQSAVRSPLAPMEARSVEVVPRGEGWQYEPKWDGFRCLVFRDGDEVLLQSKAGKPLGRYFPEIVDAVQDDLPRRCVLDGELVVPVEGRLDFDELLQRIHPAESRVRKLSAAHPAQYIAFDLLMDERGRSLLMQPLRERRERLEAFAKRCFPRNGPFLLSPATTRLAQAGRWYRKTGGDTDGLIAKRLDSPYQAGGRDAMVKVKPARTADCVVGGFRYAESGPTFGSLLLGLYDDEGLLNHVGFTTNIPAADQEAVLRQFERIVQPPGFTGRAPGGPSRWSTNRSTEWRPVKPKHVLEVEYDHFSGDRFRHGTSFVRWRPDKAPRQCTFEQVARPEGADASLLVAASRGRVARRSSIPR